MEIKDQKIEHIQMKDDYQTRYTVGKGGITKIKFNHDQSLSYTALLVYQNNKLFMLANASDWMIFFKQDYF